MLIAICGSICSGKKTVAQYLVEHHGFKLLNLKPRPAGGHAGTASSEALDNDDRLAAAATVFEQPEELLAHATRQWRSRFVTTSIQTETVLDVFARRPFFLLVSVDAPLSVRWRRFQKREASRATGGSSSSSSSSSSTSITPSSSSSITPAESAMTLEDFISLNDSHLYSPAAGLQPLMSRATVRLLNTSSSLAHLYATLGKLDLADPDRLRPSWDSYFMALASLAAQRSNCMKRRVGCVLVGREHRVISTGYNGTPRGLRNCAQGGCPRCNDGDTGSGVSLATCLCLHAEENALLEAGRERIREGSVLYCDTCPCLTCSIKICQVGIREVVYAQGYSMDKETAEVFREAGVKLRQFVPPANGLIHLEKMES